MDQLTRAKINQRLRTGKDLDTEAGAICDMLTAVPINLHQNEECFTVTKQDKFNFAISVHHRQIMGTYSHIFVNDDMDGARGRYQFDLMPEPDASSTAAPTPVFSFNFNLHGVFEIDGEEFANDSRGVYPHAARNKIITMVIGAVQKALTVKN